MSRTALNVVLQQCASRSPSVFIEDTSRIHRCSVALWLIPSFLVVDTQIRPNKTKRGHSTEISRGSPAYMVIYILTQLRRVWHQWPPLLVDENTSYTVRSSSIRDLSIMIALSTR